MQIKTGLRSPLPKPVESGLSIVATRINAFTAEDFVNDELFKPSMHLLSKPGKLLRPTLVLMGAQVIKDNPLEYTDLAVAVELLHVSSLIHDDIIDRDMIRRGAETVHVRYGDGAAILAGDALISKAIQLSARFGEPVMDYVARSAMDMCAGEVIDSKCQTEGTIPDLNTYLNIAYLKSGSLIGTSCGLVAKYKGMGLAEKLYKFGKDIGVAFQIRDDMLEFIEDKDDIQRTNVVATLMEHSFNGNKKAAMKRASELNNYYIERSTRWLQRSDSARLLGSYAEFIRATVDEGRVSKLIKVYASRH